MRAFLCDPKVPEFKQVFQILDTLQQEKIPKCIGRECHMGAAQAKMESTLNTMVVVPNYTA